MRAARGAALLLVLWLVLLLSGLVAGYALSARIASLQGNGLARDVVAGEAARAGVEYAASRLLDPDPAQRWAVDGRTYRWVFDGVPVDVTVRDEAAKLDLNGAPFGLLQAFFVALGEPSEAAARLAGAVVDWRDADSLVQPAGGAEDADYAAAGLQGGAKDAPFERVAELAEVLGMRPALYAAAAPHLTVYTGRAMPEAASADPLLRRAMGLPPAEAAADAAASPVAGSGTYSIESRARPADGRSVRRSVVLRMGSSGLPGSSYTTLDWQAGSAAR